MSGVIILFQGKENKCSIYPLTLLRDEEFPLASDLWGFLFKPTLIQIWDIRLSLWLLEIPFFTVDALLVQALKDKGPHSPFVLLILLSFIGFTLSAPIMMDGKCEGMNHDTCTWRSNIILSTVWALESGALPGLRNSFGERTEKKLLLIRDTGGQMPYYRLNNLSKCLDGFIHSCTWLSSRGRLCSRDYHSCFHPRNQRLGGQSVLSIFLS